MKLPLFGDPKPKPTFEFPSSDEILNFPIERVIKLRRIEMAGDFSLTKMKFLFTNGVESRLFQSLGQNTKDYSTDLDPKRHIKKIKVKVRSHDNLVWGIILTDSKGFAVAKWENEN